MTLAKAISLLLVLVSFFGCASQLQRPNTSQTIAEKRARGATTKNTDANDHLSPWRIMNLLGDICTDLPWS